jgi:hypothetical protein
MTRFYIGDNLIEFSFSDYVKVNAVMGHIEKGMKAACLVNTCESWFGQLKNVSIRYLSNDLFIYFHKNHLLMRFQL